MEDDTWTVSNACKAAVRSKFDEEIRDEVEVLPRNGTTSPVDDDRGGDITSDVD
jgi:hypothetical protein